mgnify:CR=1 FL=1
MTSLTPYAWCDLVQLVTASADGTARVYNTISGACQSILIGHEGEISKVCFNPQGTRILTASSDKTAQLWDADNGDGQWVHSPPLDMMVGMYEHSVHGPMGWKMHWPRRQLFIINFDHFTADALVLLV